jgi:hypothetical protein
VGSHFIDYDFNSTQATQFYQKALQLSRLCADKKEECSVLIGISQLKCKVGDYCAGQMYASEAQKLSKLSGNLYQETGAHWIHARCSMYLGDYHDSVTQFDCATEILTTHSLPGGALTPIRIGKAEIHLLKTEYSQAREIYAEVVETSADQYPAVYANALRNIVLIDITTGCTVVTCRDFTSFSDAIRLRRSLIPIMSDTAFLQSPLSYWFVLHMIPSDSYVTLYASPSWSRRSTNDIRVSLTSLDS